MKKKIIRQILTIIVISASLLTACQKQITSDSDKAAPDSLISSSLPWSVRLANSFILRHPGSVTFGADFPNDKWHYEQGVMLEAMRQMWAKTGDKKYFNFIEENIDRYLKDDGSINSYKYKDFNLDNINTGRALLFLYNQTGKAKYKIAADTLRKQIKNQPRTNIGGFWHKKIYPYQMWLDGLYMAEPFYAQYIQMFEEPKNYDDVTHQFITVYEKTVDDKTGLLYHAWNENKEQKWADPVTGHAPNFWGRAIGWYLMAIVDVLDVLPPDHKDRGRLIDILQKESEALLKYRDKESGLWYQLIDLGEREGNYLEASCATMFTYAFAKGANNGYLDKKFLSIALESFNSILKYHTTIDTKGWVSLHHTCSGAGLGGKPYRDGSFEYYMNVPQRTNDFKGYGPFIYAAVELEKAGLLP